MAKSRIARAVLSGLHGSDPSGPLDRLVLFQEDGTVIDPATVGNSGTTTVTSGPTVVDANGNPVNTLRAVVKLDAQGDIDDIILISTEDS